MLNNNFYKKKKVAQGAFGYIFSVEDKTNPECDTLVIKKIEKAFEHKLFARRTLRELKLLRLLKHENVKYYTNYDFKIINIDYRYQRSSSAKIKRGI